MINKKFLMLGLALGLCSSLSVEAAEVAKSGSGRKHGGFAKVQKTCSGWMCSNQFDGYEKGTPYCQSCRCQTKRCLLKKDHSGDHSAPERKGRGKKAKVNE